MYFLFAKIDVDATENKLKIAVFIPNMLLLLQKHCERADCEQDRELWPRHRQGCSPRDPAAGGRYRRQVRRRLDGRPIRHAHLARDDEVDLPADVAGCVDRRARRADGDPAHTAACVDFGGQSDARCLHDGGAASVSVRVWVGECVMR